MTTDKTFFDQEQRSFYTLLIIIFPRKSSQIDLN